MPVRANVMLVPSIGLLLLTASFRPALIADGGDDVELDIARRGSR